MHRGRWEGKNAAFQQGLSYANLGRFSEAVAAYDRALAISPAYADALYQKGFALAKLGKNEDAIAEFDKTLSKDRNNALAYHQKGNLLIKTGRYDDAIACCHTSQSIAERSRDELRTGGARYVLAQCYEDMGYTS